MLHGYTQSGTLFHAKTRALQKHLEKHLPSVSFSFPSGPLHLSPADIPGFDPSTSTPTSETDYCAWWRKIDDSDPPEYQHLDTGLTAVAKTIREEGPFTGVIGFSQGAALAAMVSSLLEPGRAETFGHFAKSSKHAIPFPQSFAQIGHPAMRFCVSYSGFRAPGERYKGFYEMPGISTPTLHVLGSLDSVVEEARSRMLVDACGGEGEYGAVGNGGSLMWHPGGHFVPSQKASLDGIVQFIRRTMTDVMAQGDGAKDDEAIDAAFLDHVKK